MAKKKTQDVIKEEVKLELTPMIDVTFLILIFFMCTLKFKTLEGKLVSYLPTDKGLSSAKADVEFEDAEVILKIEKDQYELPAMERWVILKKKASNDIFGKVRLQVDPKDDRNMFFEQEPASTFDDVQAYLRDVYAATEAAGQPPKAKINAYARTPHGMVVFVLNIMIETGYEDISYSGIRTGLIKDLELGELK